MVRLYCKKSMTKRLKSVLSDWDMSVCHWLWRKPKPGRKVIGFDILQNRVDMVNRGVNYIGDVVDEELKQLVESGQMSATTDYSLIREVDAVAILRFHTA